MSGKQTAPDTSNSQTSVKSVSKPVEIVIPDAKTEDERVKKIKESLNQLSVTYKAAVPVTEK